MKNVFLAVLALLSVVTVSDVVHAKGTDAGTVITNQAVANFEVNGVLRSEKTDVATFKVAQVSNVSVTMMEAGYVPVIAGDVSKRVSFLVTNQGNGIDTFTLSVNNSKTTPTNAFEPVSPALNKFYTSVNGVDTPVTSLTLAPNGSVTVYVLNEIPSMATGSVPFVGGELGNTELTATSTFTASVVPAGPVTVGSVAPNAGALGVDVLFAVVNAHDIGTYEVKMMTVKVGKTSEVISDPIGLALVPVATKFYPIPGAVVEYTLSAVVNGTGVFDAKNFSILDAIPANVTYVKGSMQFDDGVTAPGTFVPVTDAVDSDNGYFDIATNTVTVKVGTVSVTAGSSTTMKVKFRVTIN